VLIIGAGLSGLCAAIKLQKTGVAFTILEKNPGVGGTWLENTYPAAGWTPEPPVLLLLRPIPAWSRYFARW